MLLNNTLSRSVVKPRLCVGRQASLPCFRDTKFVTLPRRTEERKSDGIPPAGGIYFAPGIHRIHVIRSIYPLNTVFSSNCTKIIWMRPFLNGNRKATNSQAMVVFIEQLFFGWATKVIYFALIFQWICSPEILSHCDTLYPHNINKADVNR